MMDKRLKLSLCLSFLLFPGQYILAQSNGEVSSDKTATTAAKGETAEEPAGVDLKEVTIQAEKIIQKKDHVVLYLSKENEEFGTNALDAISSLNYFTININASDLKSYDGENVYILINGVPSQAKDLYSLKGKDIKQVLYYDNPPAQYRALTDGPIANIIVRRPKDYLISGYVRTSTDTSLPSTTDNAGISYRDSLNAISIDYNIGYLNLKKEKNDTYYIYGKDDYTHQSSRDINKESLRQGISASYQRFQGKNLFNIRLGYDWNWNDNQLPYSIFTMEKGKTFDGNGFTNEFTKYKNINLDAYYHYNISNDRMIVANVVGSYTRSRFNNAIYQFYGDDYPMLNFDTGNNEMNDAYGMTAYLSYRQPLLGGNFSCSVRDTYKRLNNTGSSGKSTSYGNEAHAGLGITWGGNFWSVSPTIGLDVSTTSYSSRKDTDVTPYFYLTANLYGQNRLRGFNAELNAYLSYGNPQLAQTTESRFYIDRHFISVGNSDLKGQKIQETNLKLQYFSPNGRNYLSLKIANQHFFNYIYKCLSREGDDILLSQQNVGNHNYFYANLSGRYSPAYWMYLSAGAYYYYTHYSTPNTRVRRHAISGSAAAIFVVKSFNFVLQGSTPSIDYNGDYKNYSKGMLAGQVMYYWKDFNFGVQYVYGFGAKAVARCEGFEYSDTVRPTLANKGVSVIINWSISRGKARRHESKNASNSAFDDGLRHL